MRISEEGEILIKGPSVFRGYHINPEATAEAFTRTAGLRGDLGSLRPRCPNLAGRAKDIIVTAGGKNAAPALEDLAWHPFDSQVIVVGDSNLFISALITLDPEMLHLGSKTTDCLLCQSVRLLTNIEVSQLWNACWQSERTCFTRGIDSKDPRPHKDFTEANGLLCTPSPGSNARQVLQRYAEVIDSIYGALSKRI